MEWRLLEGFPEAEVRRLISIARRRRFARNEVVFHHDDPGDSLHLIGQGPIRDPGNDPARRDGDSRGARAW